LLAVTLTPYWIIAYRKERVVAIRDRGTQAGPVAPSLSGGIDGKDHQTPPGSGCVLALKSRPGKSPQHKGR